MPAAKATAVTVLAGSLFLPEVASLPEIPFIPTLEKERITYLAALLAIVAYHRTAFLSARPGAGPEILMLVAMLGFIGTITMNRQPVFNEGALRDPLGLYWFLARSADDILTLIVPFVVGRTMFRGVEDLKGLLYVGSSRVDLQACKLEYSIVSPK